MPCQRLPELFMDIGNGVEKCPLQVEDRIADFIEHARPYGSHLVGVPENLHVRRHSLADPIALARGERRPKQRQLLADPVLVVEDAAPNRFRWVRGQYRPNLEPVEDGGQPRLRDVVLRQ